MNNNRKVLLIGRASKNLRGIATGGISKHIEDLSHSLIKKGVEPYIWDFKIRKSYKTNSGINILGVSFFYKLINISFAVIKLKILWSKDYDYLSIRDKLIVGLQCYQLKKTIEKLDFKTIHIHSLNRPITGFIRICFPTINIVITDHGFWNKLNDENEKIFKNIKTNVDLADKLIVISNHACKKFQEFNLSLSKTILIPNPISVSGIPILEELNKEKIILFNGFNKTIKIKNLKKLVAALKLDSFFNDYKLIAIVNQLGADYLKKETLNFEVEILGAQSWKNVVELYNKSKILVVPSKSESFGLVYLEALAVGTPIIGFHKTVSEFKDVLKIDIGETYNDETESAKDLRIKIKDVLSKNYDSNTLRSKLIENYDWTFQIQKFIELYNF